MDFNKQVIEEFRANKGRVGGPFEGGRVVLLTTTGARSGEPHTTPVGYLPDEERILVIASAGGGPRNPAWYHNLVANPRVRVEDGTFTYDAQAEVLTGDERDQLFARATEFDAGWGAYQAGVERTIPVVALREIPAGPPNVGADTAGAALKAIHDAFRSELGLLREEIARGGAVLSAQLRVNCLTACQGLEHHHTIEDTMVFPTLGDQQPDLAGTLSRLRSEHQAIARLLDELRTLVGPGDATQGADHGREPLTPAALLAEVDRLAAELEDHLAYEEERLIPVLDAMTLQGPS